MAAEFTMISTTAEVYMAVLREHASELVPFGTISQCDGNPHGDPEMGRMYTEWGFKTADYPTLVHDETWRIDRDRPGVRLDDKRAYFICVARRRD